MTRPTDQHVPEPPAARLWALLRSEAIAVLSYVTVLASLLSWTSFTRDPHAYLLPVALAGAIVVGVGVAGRSLRLSRLATVPAQLVIGAMAVGVLTVHNPVPLTAGARAHTVAVLDRAWDEAARFALPLHVADGIGPYLVAGGTLAVLLADILATSLRRPPLMGLVALAVFSVPFSIVGHGASWWVFALTAAAYLLLLRSHQVRRLTRWGHSLDDPDQVATGEGSTPWGARAVGPVAIGAGATVLAVAVPLLVPSVHVDLGSLGFGQGDDLKIHDPTVGMYDDLKQRSDKIYVTVEPVSGDRESAPRYLRIGVLNSFNGRTWSPGDRKVPAENTAYANFNPPAGDRSLLGPETTYRFHADGGFDSRWLPTFVYTTEIRADGDWRYDDETRDFMSTGSDTAAGRQWVATSAPLRPTRKKLLESYVTSTASVPRGSLDLPQSADEPAGERADEQTIAAVARERTAGYNTPFEKAVALQDWFRYSGDFRYSLDRPTAADARTLAAFVTTDKVGYCQQFASAMAVMARQLGIPARVAFGFLQGDRAADGSWVFRGRDLHAWPELWFSKVGWVRFEPTPADADTVAPDYTAGTLDTATPQTPDSTTQTAPGIVPQPSHRPRPAPAPDAGSSSDPEDDGHGGAVAAILVAVVVAAALLAAPAAIRRRRRRARTVGPGAGVEGAWAELADTAVDLRVAWSPQRSPRESAAGVRRVVGYDRDAFFALDRVVRAVERSRYAPSGSAGIAVSSVVADVERVVAVLRARSTPRLRRLALLWPASVLRRRRGSAVPEDTVVKPDQELVG